MVASGVASPGAVPAALPVVAGPAAFCSARSSVPHPANAAVATAIARKLFRIAIQALPSLLPAITHERPRRLRHENAERGPLPFGNTPSIVPGRDQNLAEIKFSIIPDPQKESPRE